MLTHISIENFKGIRDRVEIELKPITLLFGANSAGKSTILHALLYAQEVFERHNLNADTTAAGGSFINLGGFGQMVYGHDLDRPIKVGFQFSLDDGDFPPYEHDAEAFEVVLGTEAKQLIDKPRSAGVFLTIGWSERLDPPGPVVESCLVQLNTLDFAEITFDVTSHQRRLKLLAVDHPVFRRPKDEQDDSLSSADPPLHAHFPWMKAKREDRSEVPREDPLHCAESPALKQPSIFRSAFDEVSSLLPGNAKEGLLLPDREQVDALPRPDASAGPVETGRSARDTFWRIKYKKGAKCGKNRIPTDVEISMPRVAFDIAGLLDKMVTNTLQAIRKRLRAFSYLGPVRQIPPRNTSPPATPDASRWSAGLGAWDYLQSCDEEFVREVSDWLSAPDKFNTGVSLERRDLVYAAPASRRGKAAPRKKTKDGRVRSPTERRLVIVSADGDVDLWLYDVGVGIAQLVPAIVAALAKSAPFSGIEQPELHLHPSAQVVVGDLLIAGAAGCGRVLLVETHSEHIVLRIQRRIREITRGAATPQGPVDDKHVAVYHVGRSKDGTKITPLRLDSDGDFVDDWPGGFFPERLSELR